MWVAESKQRTKYGMTREGDEPMSPPSSMPSNLSVTRGSARPSGTCRSKAARSCAEHLDSANARAAK